jgi:hypothetical protein
MVIVNAPWDLLVAVAASPFAPWIVVAAIATVVTFFVATAGRDAIDAALSAAHGGETLALLDLSRGDAAHAIDRKVAVAPERLWTYGEEYLDHFVQKAEAVTALGSPALEVYWKFVLRADIGFAVSLAAFTVLFWLAVASVSWAPPWWLSRVAIFAECMGFLYGFADVAEDLKLVAILRDPQKIIDPAEAAAANLLTRLKFVTIVLSVVGVLFFAVLWAVNWVAPGLFGLFTRLAPLFWRPAQGRESQSGGNAAHQ